MAASITVAQRRARLAWRHRLLPDRRTDDVAAIAEHLVALHSSDPVTVYLSALARMRSPSIAAVERALYEDKTLLRHHAMRRTLWLATPRTARLMHAAATRKLASVEHGRTVKLLQDNGIQDGDAWLRVAKQEVLATLHAHGPMTTRRLGQLVPALRHPLQMAPGKSYAATQGAHTRVLLGLGFDGAIVRTRPTGSWINGAYTWAAMDTVLPGGVDDLDERDAARELADLWLRRFGPATSADLRWWMGWTVAVTRRALGDCAAVPVDLRATDRETTAGWVAHDDDATAEPTKPWVALLPSLDPTTMGWKQRAWYLPSEAGDAFDSNGNAGPTIWVDGQVVGAWAQASDGEIRTHYFVPVEARRREEVEQRIDEVRTWVGETRFNVRFPGRINASLLGLT